MYPPSQKCFFKFVIRRTDIRRTDTYCTLGHDAHDEPLAHKLATLLLILSSTCNLQNVFRIPFWKAKSAKKEKGRLNVLHPVLCRRWPKVESQVTHMSTSHSRVTDKVANGPGRQINLSPWRNQKKNRTGRILALVPHHNASCRWRKFVQPVTGHTPGRTIRNGTLYSSSGRWAALFASRLANHSHAFYLFIYKLHINNSLSVYLTLAVRPRLSFVQQTTELSFVIPRNCHYVSPALHLTSFHCVACHGSRDHGWYRSYLHTSEVLSTTNSFLSP